MEIQETLDLLKTERHQLGAYTNNTEYLDYFDKWIDWFSTYRPDISYYGSNNEQWQTNVDKVLGEFNQFKPEIAPPKASSDDRNISNLTSARQYGYIPEKKTIKPAQRGGNLYVQTPKRTTPKPTVKKSTSLYTRMKTGGL
jgi:hypothetical protein